MNAEFMSAEYLLPLIFAALLGLAVIVYVILDGYDLGVGILMGFNKKQKDRDLMISSIGPFWDANETWLVLAVGILLVAFPLAQGDILGELYLPIFVMIMGLIFRGAAFDFRVKVHACYKNAWDLAFTLGSLISSMAQGYMLGRYITAFEDTQNAFVFSAIVAILLPIGYCLLGSCWLIMKMEGDLFKKSVTQSKILLYAILACMVLVSVITPLMNERIAKSWFSYPNILFLAPVPALSLCVVAWMHRLLCKIDILNSKYHVLPIIIASLIFLLCFYGIAWDIFPYIVPNKLTIWEAAAHVDSLIVILIGVIIVLPFLLGYTAFSYFVFRGKTSESLSYH